MASGARPAPLWPVGAGQWEAVCPPTPLQVNQVAPVREGWRLGRRHSGWYQVFPETLGYIFRLAGP